ncbi:unnamed protein product [Spirodela intermedia]|uniref:Uncharacterized protein n=1 Tax=Spirodela intermedia TaxID=51605 RepID=A0A7I8JSK1_SPIIN|nr:unnamed protein product [Spirodela intermedia]CAA6672402.1 unnamed protein product [Spirodela intermedia]
MWRRPTTSSWDHSWEGEIYTRRPRRHLLLPWSLADLSLCILQRGGAQGAIFYSYSRFINGFAAMLEDEEVAEISKSPAVRAVFPNEGRQLHTTRSWNFLGLESSGGVVPEDSIWKKARFGEDTIIGNLDTGTFSPNLSLSLAFPLLWFSWSSAGGRGVAGVRQLRRQRLGAHSGEVEGGLRPRRHGTHTLSTAGGNFVPGVNVFGFGNGTAKGGAPRARVAAYKVCWKSVAAGSCFDADTLAAIDAAIHDGVDVLSISLGGNPSDYAVDALAIGSFHAVKNGITVACSGGNSGPASGSISNVAPWIFTIAASTMDRKFPSAAVLGNRAALEVKLLLLPSFLPSSSSGAHYAAARLCSLGSLDPEKVKGKIVACLRGNVSNVEKGQTVLLAGGVGVIITNPAIRANHVPADPHVLPAVGLSYKDGLILYNYSNSFANPVARIIAPTTVVGTKPAPFMAAFSSRGPNPVNPEILKVLSLSLSLSPPRSLPPSLLVPSTELSSRFPVLICALNGLQPDITAPGVSVLAAFTEAVGPSDNSFDNRRVRFNILSGTSMSCPHISGVAGLLKTLHPDWSPAAIKSAIMTTATTDDNQEKPILDSFFFTATPFSYGAGHVRPNVAMDPGLVYDLTVEDYLRFLCAIGYTSGSQVAMFSEAPFSCPKSPSKLLDFNYPSISVPQLSNQTTVTRKVTNVGPPGIYRARVVPPPGISVKVNPERIAFKSVGEVKEFKVTMEAERSAAVFEYLFGRLTWSDGVHNVGSPLMVLVLPKDR